MSAEFASHPLRACFGLYQMHMSRLCLILKNIVNTRFAGRNQARTAELYAKLLQWRDEIPLELQWNDSDCNLDVFSLCLCSCYNHHLILLHQEQPTPTLDPGSAEGDMLTEISIPSPETAAHNTSRDDTSITSMTIFIIRSHYNFNLIPPLKLCMIVNPIADTASTLESPDTWEISAVILLAFDFWTYHV